MVDPTINLKIFTSGMRCVAHVKLRVTSNQCVECGVTVHTMLMLTMTVHSQMKVVAGKIKNVYVHVQVQNKIVKIELRACDAVTVIYKSEYDKLDVRRPIRSRNKACIHCLAGLG